MAAGQSIARVNGTRRAWPIDTRIERRYSGSADVGSSTTALAPKAAAFGSVWDTQIGVPRQPSDLSSLRGAEDLDEDLDTDKKPDIAAKTDLDLDDDLDTEEDEAFEKFANRLLFRGTQSGELDSRPFGFSPMSHYRVVERGGAPIVQEGGIA